MSPIKSKQLYHKTRVILSGHALIAIQCNITTEKVIEYKSSRDFSWFSNFMAQFTKKTIKTDFKYFQ